MHGIFQVENHGIGRVEQSINVVLRFRAWEIETRSTQAILGRRSRKWMLLRQRSVAEGNACPPGGGLDASGDDKRQSALVMNRNPGVLHSELSQNLASLFHDGRAVIRRNPRLQGDLDAATVARLKGDVDVRPNLFTPVARLGGAGRRSLDCATHGFLKSFPQIEIAKVAGSRAA